MNGMKYYERSKPSYAEYPVSEFMSVRTHGAKGDGVTDGTAALQRAIDAATADGKILFVDAGTYCVTRTIIIPSGSKLVGESYPVIMSSGKFFASMSSPKTAVQVGKPEEVGTIEWSDMIVATQGPQPGAVLIEFNLASHGEPSGMWDVHTRIGGFAGSHLQLADCPATPATITTNRTRIVAPTLASAISLPSASFGWASVRLYGNGAPSASISTGKTLTPLSCIGAFMSMHVTPSASNLYMEVNWLWTADHDLDAAYTNITIYSGRGLFIESGKGNIWLVGTSVEHHALYRYQLANTQSILAGQIQPETAYYQPHPDINAPFNAVPRLNDPTAKGGCKNGTNCDGLGLRVLDSQNVNIYGAGLYSFFDDYNTCE